MANLNYKPTKVEAQFKKRQDKLREELNVAYRHLTIAKHLMDLMKDYTSAYNIAPTFWALTINAHVFETIIRLWGILEKRKDTINVNRELDFIEQNPKLFSHEAYIERLKSKQELETGVLLGAHKAITLKMVNDFRHKLDELPKENLRRLRHKGLAHVNGEIVEAGINVFEEYPINIEEIEQMMDVVDNILNTCSGAYNGIHYEKHLALEGGIDDIMDAINLWIDSKQKRQSSQVKNIVKEKGDITKI